MKNLAADTKFKAVKEGLGNRLEAYLKQTGDPRIEGRDPWQSYVYYEETGYGAKFNRSLSEEEREKAMVKRPIR